MKLKGEMSMLNVLQLQDANIDGVCAELKQKVDEAPQFFIQSPLIIDCTDLNADIDSINFELFRNNLIAMGFIPVGIRNAPERMNRILAEAGWAVMRATMSNKASINEKNQEPYNEKNDEQEKGFDESEPSKQVGRQVTEQVNNAQLAARKPTVLVDRTVRSGQQIYAADADMTVLAAASSGSELMADGSIHIYGNLRGRVLAGARGNESARIYCQSLQAELFAIAGRYQLLDECDTHLKGKPAMIRLEGEKLIIEAIA